MTTTKTNINQEFLSPLKAIAEKHYKEAQDKKGRKKPKPRQPKIVVPEDLEILGDISDAELDAIFDEIVLDRELGSRSMSDYSKMCWPRVEPGVPYDKNAWHSDCLSEHMQAVVDGQIKKLLISIPPGHGKPVFEENLVLMGDGSQKPLRDVIEGDRVVTHTGRTAEVTKVHTQGELDCLEIITKTGRKTIAALEHEFLTPTGWKRAGELVVGECLTNVFSPTTYPDRAKKLEEYRLAGYFIGDGCCVWGTASKRPGEKYLQSRITCYDEIEQKDIDYCCRILGFESNTRDYNYQGKRKRYTDIKGGVKQWLRNVGLAGQNSHTKRVPKFVFTGDQEAIANFVGAYFACDGYLNKKGKVRKDLCIEFTTVSKGLAKDVQHLLLRIGIQSRIRDKKYVNGICYVLTINGRDNNAKFLERIPIFHEKKERLLKWNPIRDDLDRILVPDEIAVIRNVGPKECRCLSLDRYFSFTSDDLVVHNSTWANIFMPTYAWIQQPHLKMVFGSYGYDLASRDADKCLRLMKSKWWQNRWGYNFELTRSVTRKITNDMGGIRGISSIKGQTLGIRANIAVADDPLNINEVDSEVARKNVHNWWVQGMRSRGDIHQREIVIMQRLHDDDLIGYLLSEVGGYEILKLPAEFIPEDRCKTFTIEGTEFWRDPRKDEGEVLFKKHFPKEYLDERRGDNDTDRNMFSAMYQQDPVQPGGNIIKTNWFRFYQCTPEEQYAKCSRALLSCDPAVKEKDTSTFTVIQIWGVDGPNLYLIDQLRARMSFTGILEGLKSMITKWNTADGPGLQAKLVEDKATGPAIIETLTNQIPGIIAWPGDDDKQARMEAITWLWQAGNVYVPGRPARTGEKDPDFSIYPWMVEWYDEITRYPKARFTDQAITMSQALMYIARQMKNLIGVPIAVAGSSHISDLRMKTRRNYGIPK